MFSGFGKILRQTWDILPISSPDLKNIVLHALFPILFLPPSRTSTGLENMPVRRDKGIICLLGQELWQEWRIKKVITI